MMTPGLASQTLHGITEIFYAAVGGACMHELILLREPHGYVIGFSCGARGIEREREKKKKAGRRRGRLIHVCLAPEIATNVADGRRNVGFKSRGTETRSRSGHIARGEVVT